jgi:hypothetical protein
MPSRDETPLNSDFADLLHEFNAAGVRIRRMKNEPAEFGGLAGFWDGAVRCYLPPAATWASVTVLALLPQALRMYVMTSAIWAFVSVPFQGGIWLL